MKRHEIAIIALVAWFLAWGAPILTWKTWDAVDRQRARAVAEQRGIARQLVDLRRGESFVMERYIEVVFDGWRDK